MLGLGIIRILVGRRRRVMWPLVHGLSLLSERRLLPGRRFLRASFQILAVHSLGPLEKKSRLFSPLSWLTTKAFVSGPQHFPLETKRYVWPTISCFHGLQELRSSSSHLERRHDG